MSEIIGRFLFMIQMCIYFFPDKSANLRANTNRYFLSDTQRRRLTNRIAGWEIRVAACQQEVVSRQTVNRARKTSLHFRSKNKTWQYHRRAKWRSEKGNFRVGIAEYYRKSDETRRSHFTELKTYNFSQK